jgi:predicted Rdx family selenoprotein
VMHHSVVENAQQRQVRYCGGSTLSIWQPAANVVTVAYVGLSIAAGKRATAVPQDKRASHKVRDFVRGDRDIQRFRIAAHHRRDNPRVARCHADVAGAG